MVLATAHPAHAQGGAGGPPADESLLFQDLSRVVGASRYEQDTREAPASITIVTAEDIQRYGYRSLGEVLASVRGFLVNYDRNYSYVGVRGFNVPGDFNSRLLFLVDGHRINDNVYELGFVGTDELVDLSLVERIEVIRGPSSSLYGTSAVFGVVNIVTRQPRWLQGARATGEGASYGSYRSALAFGRKFGGGAELMLFGSRYRSDGQDLYFPEFNDPATNNGWAMGADRDGYDRGFAKLVVSDFTLQAGFNSRLKHIPTGSYGTNFNDRRARTNDVRSFGFLRYSHGFADVSRLEATVSYDGYDYHGHYPYPDNVFADYGIGRWWTLVTQYVRPVGKRHRIIVGGEFRHDTRKDQGGDLVDSGTVVFRDAHRDNVWAVFAQDELRLARGLLVSGGVRHDRYDTFGGTTNPRVSVVYTPGRTTAVKLLYGRAFRAPNAYELYYTDNGFSSKAPASLNPEHIRSYEAVIEGMVVPGVRATASVFHLDLDNLVAQVLDPADSLLVFRNVNRARSTGAEVEADLRLAQGLSARGSYTYQRAADPATGAELANSPRHLATFGVSGPVAGEHLRASLDVRYVGRQRTNAGSKDPAHATADLTLLGHLAHERLLLSGSVYNLFDAAYGDPGGPEQTVVLIPQDRRNYRIGIQYQF